LSNESNSDDIPVNVISDNEIEHDDSTEESKSLEFESDDILKLLELEKQKSSVKLNLI
jgi:hypothetical protein